MRYIFFVFMRYLLTALCKIQANIAKLLRFWWTVSVLEFFLKRRANSLMKESIYCMNKTKKWQKKAEKCISAYHEWEKETKPKETK